MKKLLSLLLVGVMCVSVTACSRENSENNTEKSPSNVAKDISTESTNRITDSTILSSAITEESLTLDSWSQKATDAENFEIEVNGSSARIIKYLGTEDNVVIPREIFGYTVTSIDKDTFVENKVNLVEIPNTIDEWESLRNGDYNNYAMKIIFEKPLLPESGDNFEYVISGGGIKLTGYNGNQSNLWIPSVINGIPVVELDKNVFNKEYADYSCNIYAIHVPDNIHTIHYNTFYYESLQSVTLPESINEISGDIPTYPYSLNDGMFAFGYLGYFSASQKIVDMFISQKNIYDQVYYNSFGREKSFQPIIEVVS